MTVYVALSGTHSTGKTTLARELYKKFSNNGVNVVVVEEVVRGFDRGEIGSVDMQKMIYDKMYRELRKLDGKYDLVISDRGMLDVIAYVVHNGVMFDWGESDYLTMKEVVADLIEADRIVFDCYVFCPVENFELVEDGFRFTNDKLRHMVDFLIFSFLELSGRRYCVYRRDVDEVYDFIMEVLCNEDE